MAAKAGNVDEYMRDLDHPLKPEIEALRSVIKSAGDGITERIKWNAPSFCYHGDDRITMKLHPPTQIQLVFHRGAGSRDGADPTFAFADESGLIKWVTNERGVMTLKNMAEVEAQASVLRAVARAWMEATVHRSRKPDAT